jgi:hypothetical protein
MFSVPLWPKPVPWPYVELGFEKSTKVDKRQYPESHEQIHFFKVC